MSATTPTTNWQASKDIQLSRICKGDFDGKSMILRYARINGIGKWLGGRTPTKWRYAR